MRKTRQDEAVQKLFVLAQDVKISNLFDYMRNLDIINTDMSLKKFYKWEFYEVDDGFILGELMGKC